MHASNTRVHSGSHTGIPLGLVPPLGSHREHCSELQASRQASVEFSTAMKWRVRRMVVVCS